jgi:exo-beta-1,3-glucanase (GH17 family)
MLNQLFSRLWSYGVFCFILLVLVGYWVFKLNQPISIVTPNLNHHNKLNCVSYAPYYGNGQSPFVVGIKISSAQIDSDLKRLASISDCVRTYSVGQGLDYVPEAASKIGLKVYLGAWVGWTNADNEAEIKLAVKLANQYPDSIKALIIGNEVFLRQEQTPATMHRYLRYAKSHTKTPITYAEVWEFWNKHQDTAQYVDFVTVHILPYWEDDPVAIENAVSHASNIMNQLAVTFKKPILIGETGWPSLGRQRNESKPSLVNQARYVREFLQMAHQKNWQYNIIEAIDQPWKRVLEGTVGGYWGVYDTNLQPKFSLSAPVAERVDHDLPIYLGLIGAMLFTALSLLKQERRVAVLFGNACLGATAGLVGMLQYDYLIAASRDITESMTLFSVAVLGWLTIVAMPLYLSPLRWANQSVNVHAMIKFANYALIIAAIIASYLIFFDGRYRDYPNLLFILPAVVLSLGLMLSNKVLRIHSRMNYLVCALLFILALLCLLKEPNNEATIAWFMINCLMVLTIWPRSKSMHTVASIQ